MHVEHLVLGILAHVDAGKTTLSEAMLYTSGNIRKLGRVDNQDAFLDTDALERKRGITIFSKQARMQYAKKDIILLDTPGHVDFSAEMERTLQVLDYAILVVSGADGVQGHTRTLWRLLESYQIPVFIFVNKMDQPGTDRAKLLNSLQKELSTDLLDFSAFSTWEDAKADDIFAEHISMYSEETIEYFLEDSSNREWLTLNYVQKLIKERKLFPCFFGSALRLDGVDRLLEGINYYTSTNCYPENFGARVYKIGRDEQDNRLTFMKITGGSLKIKALIGDEKVNQIRKYSGEKFEAVSEIFAGDICAVTGLTTTMPGVGLGIEEGENIPILEPVLNYQVILPEGVDPAVALPKLRKLEEEEPELHVLWLEDLQEIQMQVMGKVQIEVLQNILLNRFGLAVEFGTGHIVYKETIGSTVEGVGHFEPLRHYAEVHLLMEPGEPGSGLQFAALCSEDCLDKNWQRLVLTHLEEREHKGVLTGSPITDMRITLIAGKAHLKHTEGGDFRQATYRAVRHGLMQAKSILLEPSYEFRLELPLANVGRAMTDLERMFGKFTLTETDTVANRAVIEGSAPVSCMQDYQAQVSAYTAGEGHLFCRLSGYVPCHDEACVIEEIGYVAEADIRNTADSVFCSHGAGVIVPWDQVECYMHLDSGLNLLKTPEHIKEEFIVGNQRERTQNMFLDKEEIEAILNQNSNANKRADGHKRHGWSKRQKGKPTIYDPSQKLNKPVVQRKKPYLLVDGYNVIFAWEKLKELAKVNIDSARDELLDIMCDYQAVKGMELIVVFDAYRVKGHDTEFLNYHNIHVVYTKEAETADRYIEKFAHDNSKNYQITVATSDGMEQIIIRGAGCALISSRELEVEVDECRKQTMKDYYEKQPVGRNYLMDQVQIPLIENE